MTKIGARVWAIREETDTTIYTYGFGTYIGDRLRPGWNHPTTLDLCTRAIEKSDAEHDAGQGIDPTPFYDQKVGAGEMTREQADAELLRGRTSEAAQRARPLHERALDLARSMGMNPVIHLDTGGYVWAAECWWGEANDTTPAKRAAGRAIVWLPATTTKEPA